MLHFKLVPAACDLRVGASVGLKPVAIRHFYIDLVHAHHCIMLRKHKTALHLDRAGRPGTVQTLKTATWCGVSRCRQHAVRNGLWENGEVCNVLVSGCDWNVTS